MNEEKSEMESIILHCFMILLEILPVLYYSQAVESQGERDEGNKREDSLGVNSFCLIFFSYVSVKRTAPCLRETPFPTLSSFAVFSMQLSHVNSFIAESFDAFIAP